MINVKALNNQGKDTKSRGAVIECLMATEYYPGKEGQAQEAMAWGGKMADHLGLVGQEVTRKYMLKLAAGFDPVGVRVEQPTVLRQRVTVTTRLPLHIFPPRNDLSLSGITDLGRLASARASPQGRLPRSKPGGLSEPGQSKALVRLHA